MRIDLKGSSSSRQCETPSFEPTFIIAGVDNLIFSMWERYYHTDLDDIAVGYSCDTKTPHSDHNCTLWVEGGENAAVQ